LPHVDHAIQTCIITVLSQKVHYYLALPSFPPFFNHSSSQEVEQKVHFDFNIFTFCDEL